MKKLLFPLFILLFFFACEKDDTNEILLEESTYENDSATTRANKRDVCHNGNIININVNAIPAHQGHGDAVDMDEDGFFDIENPCSETDCDDTTYDPDNSCCEEGYEIDFEGPLFVALADEAGYYTWQEAVDACAAKAAGDGCGWHLPSKEELNALFLARNDIGGFDQSDIFPGNHYWSTTELVENVAWGQFFSHGVEGLLQKSYLSSCRCVRK